MKFQTQIALIAATAATLSQAATVNVCKGQGKTECIPVDAPAFICTNLVSADGRPFISGYSDGAVCDIYSSPNCNGIGNTVDGSGWSRFPFNVWSIEC
ncbi:hypothetical protein N0V84_001832 [Fusarium piperis]|uniref:Uncharacterized protein n=1 Tax=Fusarium piperis TaxID=1435070 RepID=A0A9W9BTX6_9HYPO|nr:hypothetical protein N0V84_001832 [Fusarium piperis]